MNKQIEVQVELINSLARQLKSSNERDLNAVLRRLAVETRRLMAFLYDMQNNKKITLLWEVMR